MSLEIILLLDTLRIHEARARPPQPFQGGGEAEALLMAALMISRMAAHQRAAVRRKLNNRYLCRARHFDIVGR